MHDKSDNKKAHKYVWRAMGEGNKGEAYQFAGQYSVPIQNASRKRKK